MVDTTQTITAESSTADAPRPRWRLPTPASSERAATWVFGAYVAVAAPLLVFVLVDFFWFFRDDWMFITERELNTHDLFEPHAGHWVTSQVVAFRALFAVFGIRSYLPYQATVVVLHLTLVVLLRVIMRRAGVGPWLATAVASAGVLFGPGREDIAWAFQIGFTGSLLCGVAHLVLADHDGPIGRRDALGLLVALLGLTLGSPVLIMVAVTGAAMLVRRGWRAAALHTMPLGAVYLVWSALTDPETSVAGDPPLGVLWDWVRHGTVAGLRGLAHRDLVMAALAAVLVVGLGIAVLRPGGPHQGLRPWPAFRRIAVPVAMLGGIWVFMVLSARARWIAGAQASGAGRYVYVYAMLALPAIGVAIQALAHRWRPAAVVGAGLLLSAVPANIARFDDRPFGPAYHAGRRAVLTTVVRLPYVRDVDPAVRPIPDPYMGEGVDLGFLLWAESAGKLEPSTGPIPPALQHELDVRVGLSQGRASGMTFCDWVDGPTTYAPERGDEIRLSSPVGLQLIGADGQPQGAPIPYDPREGTAVTVQRDDLEVRVTGRGQPTRTCLIDR